MPYKIRFCELDIPRYISFLILFGQEAPSLEGVSGLPDLFDLAPLSHMPCSRVLASIDINGCPTHPLQEIIVQQVFSSDLRKKRRHVLFVTGDRVSPSVPSIRSVKLASAD
jgi:hypothetical protein